ncbi:MAG: Uma2 family endonuclease [Hamadaea sp.]|nr:Uma2 family endonuclease [Hamadaea sp.]
MTVTANPFTRVWTEADLAELPDGARYEIIDGRLYVAPPAGETHQALGTSVLTQLHLAAPAGWRVMYEIGIAIGDDRFIPDLIVLPPGVPKADQDYNDVAVVKPQLIVEIASRSTQTTDAGDKMVAYARGGIPAYWRVSRDGTIYLHRLASKEAYTLIETVAPGGSAKVLFPFELSLNARAV